ncbi:MAG: hypothetical protein AMXMBFR45_23800 [Gammaproteobacteria bacterium]
MWRETIAAGAATAAAAEDSQVKPRTASLATALLALALTAGCAPARKPEANAHAAPPANATIVRSVVGVLDCTTLSKGEPCGREAWTLTVQADGSRTMRAFFDGGRDAQQISTIYRADAAFRFLEAFSTAYSKGKLLGSGFYVADGSLLHVTTRGSTGYKAEDLPLPQDYSVLLHPPSIDGWHFGHYDSAAGGRQKLPTFVFGGVDGGPRVAAFPITLEFVGRETITVPAGRFETEHYHYGKDTEVWIMGPDRIMVRHEYRAADTRFELTQVQGPVGGRL